MRIRILPIMLILLIAVAWSGCSSRPVTSGPAPDFTLDSLDGDMVTLSDLKGQVVVLDFWASWCNPCVEGLDHLQQVLEDYADQGVAALAINVEESRDEAAEFAADHGYTLTVLLDADGSVTDAYGVRGIPHTVIVDRDGEIHSVLAGSDDVGAELRQLLVE